MNKVYAYLSYRWLLLLVLVLAACVIFSLTIDGGETPVATRGPLPIPLKATLEDKQQNMASVASFPPTAVSEPVTAPLGHLPVAAPAEPELSVAALEQRFRTAQSTPTKTDIVQQIAAHNDADAVRALARIFPLASHPAVKLEIISRLADIDEDAAPEARMQLLEAALHGQPRDARFNAISLLANIETPRATALLQGVAETDPARENRELAVALLQERTSPVPP